MILDIKVPSPGESINEVEVSNWLIADGDYVEKDQEICEIDSDKATLTISAEDSGQIKILTASETVISVGEVICQIDTSAKPIKKKAAKSKKEPSFINLRYFPFFKSLALEKGLIFFGVVLKLYPTPPI